MARGLAKWDRGGGRIRTWEWVRLASRASPISSLPRLQNPLSSAQMCTGSVRLDPDPALPRPGKEASAEGVWAVWGGWNEGGYDWAGQIFKGSPKSDKEVIISRLLVASLTGGFSPFTVPDGISLVKLNILGDGRKDNLGTSVSKVQYKM